MARSIQKYLYDIQQSISSIEEYLGEKRDFFAYEQNKLLRRAVIHGYDKVDNVIIWGVVNKNLPKLKEQVEDLLGGFTIL